MLSTSYFRGTTVNNQIASLTKALSRELGAGSQSGYQLLRKQEMVNSIEKCGKTETQMKNWQILSRL